MPAKKRNYRKEYDSYHAKPAQKKNRASRNSARRKMTKLKGKSAVAGKDVDHKNRNARDNRTSNLRITSKSSNRGRNK